MGATTEAAIRNEGYAFAQSCTDQCRSRLQHLRHTRSPFRTHLTDHHYITGFDLTGVDAVDQFKLTIKYTSRAYKALAFFTTDLGYTATFCQVTVQDLQVTSLLDRRF